MSKASSNRLVCSTIFMLALTEFLQSGMTAFAAAPIMGEVAIGPEEFSLIAAVYASLAILAISLQRWWVERVGGQRFTQAGAVVCVAGALVCASSRSFSSFLLGRALMALGGGAFFTASRMIIQHRLAGSARFVGIRCLATGLAVGIAAAPWLAATAVAQSHWSAMYLLLAALGTVVFVLATLALDGGPRDVPQRRSAAQPWQQLLLLGASFGLLYALQRLYYDFYSNTVAVLLVLAGALAALALYLHAQHRHAEPLLRVREMWSPRFLAGLALFGFAYLVLGANNYVVPMLLQRALGFGWQTVGLVEALGLGAALLTWDVMSRLLPRYPSPGKFLVTGFLALAASGALLTQLNTGADLWRHVLPALALNSVFLLTVLPVSAMQTFRGVEHDESVFSHAQQLKNMPGAGRHCHGHCPGDHRPAMARRRALRGAGSASEPVQPPVHRAGPASAAGTGQRVAGQRSPPVGSGASRADGGAAGHPSGGHGPLCAGCCAGRGGNVGGGDAKDLSLKRHNPWQTTTAGERQHQSAKRGASFDPGMEQ